MSPAPAQFSAAIEVNAPTSRAYKFEPFLLGTINWQGRPLEVMLQSQVAEQRDPNMPVHFALQFVRPENGAPVSLVIDVGQMLESIVVTYLATTPPNDPQGPQLVR